MPKLNNVNIKDAEFTAMQEKATAFIFKRTYLPPKKRFTSAQDIVKDKDTVKGLKEIFVKDKKQLFNYTLPFSQKAEQNWFETFYKQHAKILQVFPNAKFTIFDRDDKGGFMMWFQNLIKEYYNISKKDMYNPADIWLIDQKDVNRKIITAELKQSSDTRTIEELNVVMRGLYKQKKVVGLSLKLVSGQQAQYQEVNLDDKFFKEIEGGKDNYDFRLSAIRFMLGTQGKGKNLIFNTQDTSMILSLKGQEKAKFQVKGNQTSKLANLKIEGTGRGEAARLGKAPLELVENLTKGKPYNKVFENAHLKFPKTSAEFRKESKKYQKKYDELVKQCSAKKIKLETGITSKQFTKNILDAFDGQQPFMANSKLMQLTYIHMVTSLKNSDLINEYVTDLIFLCQKIGRKVFPFGPFGKLY